jgi:hypothetical protein
MLVTMYHNQAAHANIINENKVKNGLAHVCKL